MNNQEAKTAMITAPINPKDKEQELTFYVRVQFRRNSSMQGAITWVDGRKTISFRSALELGNLIDSARSTTLNDS